jgi:hypothetical protein
MPTIDQLPDALAASDTDELLVSQGGVARKMTRAQMLAGVQPSLAVGAGQVLAGPPSGYGAPQCVSLGNNLVLANGTLSAASSGYSIGSLPPGQPPTASNLVGVSESGTDVSVSYATFMSSISGLSGINLSSQTVVPTGSSSAVTLANFAANTLQRSGGQLTGPLLLASDPSLPLQATTKEYADQRVLRSGDTMTGPLALAADPTQPLQAATKEYVDTRLYQSGDQPFSGDLYSSPQAVQLGGFTNNDSRSLTIRGAPYGFYDTGSLISVVSTQLQLADARAGINGGFEQGVVAIANDPDFDSVVLYVQPTVLPPRLVIGGVTYDASHVYFNPPLTAAQMALLNPGMWVITNSIDPTVSATPPPSPLPTPTGVNTMLPPHITYASTILSWAPNGSSITINGWTVPGSGHTQSGQVPGTTDLDTTNNHTTPTVFIGGPTKTFAQNWYIEYNPQTAPDSKIRQMQGLEIDLQNFGTDHYQVNYQGIVIGYNSIRPGGAASDGLPLKPTDDSFSLLLSGGYGMPVGLRTSAFTVAQWEGDGFWFSGTAMATPAATVGSTNLNAEFFQYADTNRQRLLIWGSREASTSTGGWPTTSMHIGLQIDGTEGTLNGSQMGLITFNAQGYPGGVSIGGYNGAINYGININSSGGVVMPNLPTSPSGLPHGSVWRNGTTLMIV